MKYTLKTLVLIAVVLSLFSCNRVSPDKVVAQTWLNVNKITSHYSPNFFRLLQEMKSKGTINIVKNNEVVKGTAVEYINQIIIPSVDESLKKVEKLPVKEDTKEIINASLEVYKYGKAIFENEYLVIAAMIDEGKPEAKINNTIENLFAVHNPIMQKKLDRLDALVFPYAKKHNLPFKTQTSK